jgi:hypothetical protein
MHFVGKDFQDDYSTVLKEYVNNFDLNSVLSMMPDIHSYFISINIGILPTAEGFPLVLLEYGLAQLAALI